MTETTARPKAKRGAFTAYAALWLVLAGLALGYLVLLSANPAMIAELLGTKGSGDAPDHARTQESIATLSAEIRVMHENFSEMRRELGSVRSEIAARVERENELNVRLASLESSASATAEALAAQQAAAKAATTKVAAKDAKKEAAKPAPDAKKAAAPKDAAAPAAAKPAPAAGTTLETGSVEGGGVSPFGPAVVTPAKRPVGLSLGSAPSVDSLRLNWSVLADQNADALGTLQPHYVTGINGSDLTFELIAGPVSSTAEAKRICNELIQRGNACRVGEFSGTAL